MSSIEHNSVQTDAVIAALKKENEWCRFETEHLKGSIDVLRERVEEREKENAALKEEIANLKADVTFWNTLFLEVREALEEMRYSHTEKAETMYQAVVTKEQTK